MEPRSKRLKQKSIDWFPFDWLLIYQMSKISHLLANLNSSILVIRLVFTKQLKLKAMTQLKA